MAQYFKYPPNKYQYWTFPDGTKIREGQDSSGYFVTDIEILTPAQAQALGYASGFAAPINVGWEQVSASIGTLTGNYYKGIRNCAVELLVGTNPNGVEGVDYEHL